MAVKETTAIENNGTFLPLYVWEIWDLAAVTELTFLHTCFELQKMHTEQKTLVKTSPGNSWNAQNIKSQ